VKEARPSSRIRVGKDTVMKYLSPGLLAVWIWIGIASAQDSPALPASAAQNSAERIVKTALLRTARSIRYDPSYVVLKYPGGDVPADTGVCTDVVIRTYRSALGVDLQKLIHEDMMRNFPAYPNNWGLKKPDKNIDHRRVPNLQRFFKRQGAEIPLKHGAEYLPGDLVAWDLNRRGLLHIGIVVGKDQFVHNIGSGPVLESGIHQWKIIAHYRFLPERAKHGEVGKRSAE